MKVTFYIDYRTNWGEEVCLIGTIPALGKLDKEKAVRLTPVVGNQWAATVEIPTDTPDFMYRYFIKNENGHIKDEWGRTPHIFRHAQNKDTENVSRFDAWQDMPWDRPFYSSAIVDTVNRRYPRAKATRPFNGCVTITVNAPMVAPDEVVAIAGEPAELGAWDTAKAPVMDDADFPIWTINIPAERLPRTFHFLQTS